MFTFEKNTFLFPSSQVNSVDPDRPIEITYPPAHLRHILYELFKNAMRATVEHHGRRKKGGMLHLPDLPEIEVLVAKGPNDVTVRVSDQGGGISRDTADHLFHYLVSRPI